MLRDIDVGANIDAQLEDQAMSLRLIARLAYCRASEARPRLGGHVCDVELRHDAVDVRLERDGGEAGERCVVAEAGGGEKLCENGLFRRAGATGGGEVDHRDGDRRTQVHNTAIHSAI